MSQSLNSSTWCVYHTEPGTGAMLITDLRYLSILRWPTSRWEAYKQGQTKGVDGTAIEYLTSIQPLHAAGLKSVGISELNN